MTVKALANYIAKYVLEENERSLTIDTNTILNAIEAFEEGASESGDIYKVNVVKGVRLIDTRAPSYKDIREYDAYFDECERANKTPLSFDKWQANLGKE